MCPEIFEKGDFLGWTVVDKYGKMVLAEQSHSGGHTNKVLNLGEMHRRNSPARK